jgi:enoyl-[acyl-carrier protein] reductase II
VKKNSICDLFDIKHPILQGGMLWLATARLAAAVSNAGALGVISPYAGMDEGGDPLESLRAQIRQTRNLTRNPFGINIPLNLPMSGLLIDAALQENAGIFITAAGNPKLFTELLHSTGTRVIHVVGSASQAKKAESCGVDAIVAEGAEAGARIGRDELPLFSLLPRVVECVSLPVIAAGGIADGRGMAAAMALGAAGVQLGTRFVATEECIAHPNYKRAIVDAGDSDTIVTRRGQIPARSLKNKFTMELAAMEKSGASMDRVQAFIGRGRARKAQIDGDLANGDAFAGSSAGLIKEILPVAAVVENLITDYDKAIHQMLRSLT